MSKRVPRLAILFMLVFIFWSGVNNKISAQTHTKNTFGLNVIDNIRDYENATAKDSSAKLVLLTNYVPHLKTDFVYASPQNFTRRVLYHHPKPYALLPVAQALARVAEDLEKQGLGILLFDAYRPYSVTEKMWQAVPDSRYAANPKTGSDHNRGLAVDISLYNLHTGAEIPMPTGFDNFSDTAHSNFTQLSDEVLCNRKLLRDAMQKQGFMQLSTEWWHFYLPHPNKKYPLMDISFDELNNIADKKY